MTSDAPPFLTSLPRLVISLIVITSGNCVNVIPQSVASWIGLPLSNHPNIVDDKTSIPIH